MARFGLERQAALRQFDLNLLKTLDALLEEKNVTRAAARMCVSQQALSGALKRIREFFDDELLVRVGRELQLTPLARSLVRPLRELMQSIDTTLQIEPGFDPRTSKRTFRISMSETGASVIMPRVYARLAEIAPGVTCQVEFLGRFNMGRLSSDDLDLALSLEVWDLLGSDAPGSEIRTLPLFSEDFICLCDRDHVPANGTLTLEQYKNLPHGNVQMGSGITTVVEMAWRRAGLILNVVATVPSFSALISFVPGTPLLATVPRRLATKVASATHVVQLPCPVAIPPIREVMIWHSRNEEDPGHRFIRGVIEEAADAVGD